MLRQAKFTDIDMIIELAQDMHENYPVHIKIDEDRFRLNVAGVIDQGFAFVGARSVLLGVLDRSFYSNDLIAREILWTAQDGQGMRLKRKFEEWAKEFGAVNVYFALHGHAKMPKYNAVESVWSKTL